jgi:hypothetical protein
LSQNSVAYTSESVSFCPEDSTSFWACFRRCGELAEPTEAKPKRCCHHEFEIFENAFIFFASSPPGRPSQNGFNTLLFWFMINFLGL